MNCLNDGTLRARFDNELTGVELEETNQHLASCDRCRGEFEKMAKEAAHMQGSLAFLAPPAASPNDAMEAYSLFRYQVAEASRKKSSWFRSLLAPRWRPVWGLAAAALVIATLVGFGPAGAWAQRVLALLRVQKIAVVSIDPSTLMSGSEPDARPYRLINQFISDNVVVTMDPGKPDVVPTVANASQLTGFRIRTLGSFGAPQRLQVTGEAAFQMNLNRARVQALLEEVGRTDIQVPQAADGALIAVHIPRTVVSMYGDCPIGRSFHKSSASPSHDEAMMEYKMRHLEARSNGNCVYLLQAPSPTVSLPPDLNMSEIAEAGLQLAGMDQSEAHAFCQTVDWSSTLVVPVPRNSSSSEKVSVDGVEGTLITETMPQADHYSLLWTKNGVIYSLIGRGSSSEALNLAASIQ